MSQLGIKIFATGFTGSLIIVWKKSGVEIGRSAALPFPYDDTYVIEDLQPVVYTVELWRSAGGVTLDQLIDDWSMDASKRVIPTIRTYQYLVDRGSSGTDPDWEDPTNGQVVLSDERLDGFTQSKMRVHEAGYGDKLDSEYDLHTGGGIELLGGKTFDSGVAWFITVFEEVEVDVPASSGGSKYDGIEIVGEDRDFHVSASDTLYNKLTVIDAASTRLQITFGDLSLIPDGTFSTIQTIRGAQNYCVMQFDPGDTVWFNNEEVNVIYLAKNEIIRLYFFGGVCFVDDYKGKAAGRGSVLMDFDLGRDVRLGSLLYADEATGELDKADYEGLYTFVEQLTGSAVVPLGTSVGQWGYFDGTNYPNKSKYGIDTVNEIFRVPHLSGLVAKVGVNAGTFEDAQVGEISENFNFKQGKSDDNESGVSGEYLRKPGASGGTNYGNTTVAFLFNSGLENKVKSVTQKPFIIL